MSTKAWKLEKDLCRCCHSEGVYKSLYASYFWMNVEEVMYSDVLGECFGIELAPVAEPLGHMLCGICDICIQRLHDAREFKQQVLKCEERYNDLYIRRICKDGLLDVEIKQEVLDPEDNDASYTNPHNDGEIKEDSSRRGDGGESDDDRGFGPNDRDFGPSDREDNVDCKMENDEQIPQDTEHKPRVRKKLKQKKAKNVSKVKQKRKVGRPKKIAEVQKVEIVDTIQGGIKVVKKTYQLQENTDYKQIGDLFQCSRCDKRNQFLRNLTHHIKTVHLKIPKYICPATECSKTFVNMAPFTKHKLEDHNIDDRYKCNACQCMFNTKVQLKRHINSFHMLGEKYKCELCDYESFSVESLYKHKFKHKTVKDYHCMYCRKAFARKTTLQLHERIHTGDRRKVCKVCGQAFVQKASLNYHMTKYHPEVDF